MDQSRTLNMPGQREIQDNEIADTLVSRGFF